MDLRSKYFPGKEERKYTHGFFFNQSGCTFSEFIPRCCISIPGDDFCLACLQTPQAAADLPTVAVT